MGADFDVTPDCLLPPDWSFCPHPVSAITNTASTATGVTIALRKMSSSEVNDRTLLPSSGLCVENRTSHLNETTVKIIKPPSARQFAPHIVEEEHWRARQSMPSPSAIHQIT